ncbi:MAG TPA: hypothetical protein VGZ22_20995 [Isosphaeraceae bacterium]|jgi:hypothetical protein|nr:hypothetical protein [Isosphaeraceae bacterium]
MWKKYLERDQGVALISTSHRLATSFPEKSPEILIGRVSYVDYKKADFLNSDGTFNVLNFVTKKRHAFKDERELRAVIWLRNRDGELLTNNPTGIVVTVELNRLLRGIVVSPGSPGWFYNLVVSLTKRYGIKVPVSRSALAESPVR